ncbi:MAG: FtsX-like permease family protein, partial [Cyclobacteriaceae bacterium]|nr:FtsX-like permease family protein [Cyclobacteriaceae bacterium HetDA_MAG_MS6]
NINLSFDLIISHSTLRNLNPGIFKQWGMRWAASLFVLTNENTTKGTIEAALKNIPKTYFPEEHALKTIYKLQPLAQMHTDELYGDGVGYVAPSLALWAFIIMGALLLGTACLNFVNLSTAQAIKRSREVGVRKTLGGSRSQLIFQFLTETLIIVLISVVLSMTIAQVMISQLNTFLTPLDYEVSFSSSIVWFISALIVLVTLLGGLYPSLVMSSYQPIQALTQKITGKRGSGSFNLRRMLVIVQFVFTNLLLICSFIVSDQMDFLKNKPLGFNKDRVVTLGFPQGSYERMKTVKQAFEQKAYIEEATLCHGSPFSVNGDWQTGYTIQGQPYVDGQTSFWKFVDENYLEFFDIPIIEGKPLEARSINDSTYDVLVNKKFISKLGWTAKESIGRKIEFNGNRIGTIIGVTPDFHAGSLHDAIRPVLFCYEPSRIELMALRLVSSVETQALSDMEHTFRTFFPDDVFLATNLSKAIDQEYMVEDLLYGVIQFTTIISIIISMLGLYGLISFIANSNAKSIGVRKVFGASTFSIIRVFTREYFILIFIAFLLAAPLSYLGMQEWINEYAYRIDLHLGFFIWALLGSLSLAVITVGYKSYLAASANPAQSLRYE